MNYFILIYFNGKSVQVSSRLAAHHQEDQLCIQTAVGMVILPAASQHKA
jgi:hypothetical protein